MRYVSKLVVLISAILNTNTAIGQTTKGTEKLLTDTAGRAQISIDKHSGNARFIKLSPNPQLSSLRSGSPAKVDINNTSIDFLKTYGSAFGIQNVDSELVIVGSKQHKTGIQHSIFKQTYKGLPVFGGEIRTHFNSNDEMIAANGTFLSDIKAPTTPTLSEPLARKIAIQQVERDPTIQLNAETLKNAGNKEEKRLKGVNLKASQLTLMVFRAGLLKGAPGADHLVYEVEVTNNAGSVREFVYVDALSGSIIDHITGIHDALNRRAYDAEGASHPGPNYPASPYWVEGDPLPTPIVEANNMIYASAETFDFFFNAYGRNSFDNAGATMDAIFNRGDQCPNASWNGVYISFCPGLTSDDVTAHEWGHAYTEYTNNLIYQWQSGALNESYSDIWGETVDRINGRDDISAPDTPRTAGSCSVYGAGSPNIDDSVRWLMGEDTTGFGGAIRDMWTPTCYGDPGKVTDAEYFCSSADSGGVHSNSGVPNHAYALMVDGGSYNGYSGSGLGLTKSAHIHWAAQNILTSSSNFADHADALETACNVLVGTDLSDLLNGQPTGEIISTANCQEVVEIIDAVELRTPPAQCGFEPILATNAPALCDNLGTVQTFFSEDFESNSLPIGWSVSQHDVANAGTFDSPGWEIVSDLPTGNLGNYAAFGPDLVVGNCADDTEAGAIALDSPVIALPLNEVPHAAFTHWVATEAGWDGGNLKISVNGGPFTVVPSEAYSFNAYNGALNPSDNPLGGEEAFTGTNEGGLTGSWGQSQVDLYGLALPGDNIQLRFDLGTDGCNGVKGWYIDDVQAYSCSAELPPVCGDGELALGEMCDDGNSASGDGCSSSCQVESGFVCTSPQGPTDSTNIVADWSFEGGVPNADWLASSSFTGVAGFPLCGPGNSCPAASLAASGSWLVWIGGLADGVTSSVAQEFTIPAAATELTVKTWRGLCGTPGESIQITIDGIEIGSVECDNVDNNFVENTFSIAPFNDGQSHTLEIGGSVGGINGNTNFFIDDVVIQDNTAKPGSPSVCTAVITDIACNTAPLGFDQGIPATWNVVDNEGSGIEWTNIDASGIGGNYTGGTGNAASVSSDALPGEYNTELHSNSFSLVGWTTAQVEYLVNYQNYSAAELLNVDITIDGGNTWSTLLSWVEDHPTGGLFTSPGEAVSLDLSAYIGEENVQLRWHYFNPNTGDWDWYAQVDDVSLVCDDQPQALQCDINEDGFVDINDIRLIAGARNQPAEPGDPRDNDGNGIINASDARQCTLLCSSPRCAPQAP
ncbi:M4 family metallopeptidase [Flavobacterium sp. W21_SRS_FM6]|uniref:M4 family metallopeptidase n=1 Tax=Flavobacterium sp. W21_SRS_FM6 TaxID=3240268 RepID=UPI003F91EF9E